MRHEFAVDIDLAQQLYYILVVILLLFIVFVGCTSLKLICSLLRFIGTLALAALQRSHRKVKISTWSLGEDKRMGQTSWYEQKSYGHDNAIFSGKKGTAPLSVQSELPTVWKT